MSKWNVSIQLPFDYEMIEAETREEAIKVAEGMATEEMQGEGFDFAGLVFIGASANEAEEIQVEDL